MPKGIYIHKKGKKHSEETKEKIRKSNIGKHNFKHTQKALKKISNASKKLWKQKWYRDKMKEVCSQPNFGQFRKGKKPWNKGIKFDNGYWTEKKRPEISGERNNFWKGGTTKLQDRIRKSIEYKQWRKTVYERDNYICQKCGKNGRLEAHHIKSFSKIISENNIKTLEEAILCKELWNIENGETLCKSCHKKTDSYLNFANNAKQANSAKS